ncbi:hypothetical protein [Planktothrix agardhii]|nr:hypothetical protein [Planktothrix agardhii]
MIENLKNQGQSVVDNGSLSLGKLQGFYTVDDRSVNTAITRE